MNDETRTLRKYKLRSVCVEGDAPTVSIVNKGAACRRHLPQIDVQFSSTGGYKRAVGGDCNTRDAIFVSKFDSRGSNPLRKMKAVNICVNIRDVDSV